MAEEGGEVILTLTLDEIPYELKLLFGDDTEWVAIIPPKLTSPDVEELFLRTHTVENPVHRAVLPNGSVAFFGAALAHL